MSAGAISTAPNCNERSVLVAMQDDGDRFNSRPFCPSSG